MCKDDVRDFVEAGSSECHFLNGTQRVLYVQRYFYNQKEFLYYDSDVGHFIGKDEFGSKDAEIWNKDEALMADARSSVERFCKYNYEWLDTIKVNGKKVEPSIKISLMNPDEQSHTKQHMLVCNVYGFYPSEIEVKWYRNGGEETEQVQFTEPYHNGDWSYQILVMLETEMEKGDTFTCEVHHSSLKTPHRVDWHPQLSDAAKKKMATGILGFVLGIVSFVAGLVAYMKGREE
ncbi:H-2 class II histocompatibility antigen, I-E beta chain-like [Leptodactylus fuscus]|uniref:H-2 class II histocompatibility antigen, I-E beta chain-like n=1 Tax=Leptodactylus fuscus TaxID=238119 RepID=UPI003F4ED214